MPERIRVDTQSEATHFAIAAIVDVSKKDKQLGNEIPVNPDGYLDVVFTVNGAEMPFEKTVKNIYDRFQKQIEQEAAKIVYRHVKLHGLENLKQTIENFDWKIREQIKEILGVELSD